MYIYVLYIGHVIRWQYSSVKKLAADVCAILTVLQMIRNFAHADPASSLFKYSDKYLIWLRLSIKKK